jgi:hypothetical protein
MAADDDEPDALVHEILRCTRGDETRIYTLRVVSNGVELWRIIESPGANPRSIKESHFTDVDETSQFLDEVRRTLRAGGWREE